MRKMDEMEQSIALQSVRWSWGFGFISLVLYNFYLRVTTGEYNITGLIAAGMFLIQQLVFHYKKQQAGEDKAFWRYVMLVILFIVIFFGILFMTDFLL